MAKTRNSASAEQVKETLEVKGETEQTKEAPAAESGTEQAKESQAAGGEAGQTEEPPVADKAQTMRVDVPGDKGLSLREGPHTSYNRLMVLENDSLVERLPLPDGIEVPGWSAVTTPTATGWVATEFLREV